LILIYTHLNNFPDINTMANERLRAIGKIGKGITEYLTIFI